MDGNENQYSVKRNYCTYNREICKELWMYVCIIKLMSFNSDTVN